MALSISPHLHLPQPSPKLFSQKPNPPHTTLRLTPKSTKYCTKHPLTFTKFTLKPHKFTTITKATQEEDNTTTTNENPPPQSQVEKPQKDEMTELGAEIKKAMKERAEQKESEGLLSGVFEEIREIEWPAFNKVLGTTGVVLGVIAGSSVVLLTVNVVLAELSDRVFAGKGVQDFFG